MASNESFKQAIKAYLDKRAEEDSLFAPKYANEKKSIDECCSYIMGEARKRGNAVAISDEEVYGMAVHYYDEDDIKINRLPAGEKASVSSCVVTKLYLIWHKKNYFKTSLTNARH